MALIAGKSTAAIVCVAFVLAAGQARATTIDFDALPAGTDVTNQFAGLGVLFNSAGGNAGSTQTTNVIDIVPTTSGNNSLAPNGPTPHNGGTLILNFIIPVASVGSFFIDDQLPVDVTAFDAGNAIVGTDSSDGSNVGFDDWFIAHAGGITRVELVGGLFGPDNTDGWGIDDLTFVTVPEPCATTLGLLALTALGMIARRKRSASV